MAIRLFVCCVLAAVATAKDAPKSVRVDCAKGESVSAALDSTAAALVVEFTGVCAEDLVIERDDVTLRGAAPGAALGSIAMRGVDSIRFENFAVANADGRGLDIRACTNIQLDGIVANGNGSDGLLAAEGASVRIRNSSFNDNGGDGIGLWQDSSLTLEGTIATSGNGRMGILVSHSDLSLAFAGAHGTSNDNVRCGYFVQLAGTVQWGAAGPHSATANGNGDCGVRAVAGGLWTGALIAADNPIGVDVVTGSFGSSPPTTISGGNIGVRADHHSHLTLDGATIGGSNTGVRVDGASATFRNTNITGNAVRDVHLLFGARAAFNGANTVGVVNCESSVLVRGNVSCPAMAMQSRVATEAELPLPEILHLQHAPVR